MTMSTSRRLTLAVAVVVVLCGAVFAAYWYQMTRSVPGPSTGGVTVDVTQGGDRGPGSLREALFIAAAANSKATVSIKVPRVALLTALPPLVNANGMSITAPPEGAQIDAQGLGAGAVFDISGANISIQGVTILNCPGAGILLRATRFRLEGSTIERCDVAVDIAENAGTLLIERNRFIDNRVGLRFAASNRDANVIKNEFANHKDAAIWAVRSAADSREPSITVRDNRFSKETLGVLAGNVAMLIERNEFRDSRNAAIQLIGQGALVRGNRISGGAAMGIVAENAVAAIVESNELDHLTAYGIMVKTSSNTLVKGNKLHNCGYGLAFVLGDAANPSTAVDNTIIAPKYNGIDIIGDSPILRRNHVLRPRVRALSVSDFTAPDGTTRQAKPFLEGNRFEPGAATIAARKPAEQDPVTSR